MVSFAKRGYGARGMGVHRGALQGVINVFMSGRKRLSAFRVRTWIKDDRGIAALLLVAVITTIAFAALSVFLNKLIGDRALQRAQSAISGQGRVLPSLYAYYLSDVGGVSGTAPHKLPCPDTAATPTGTGISSCNTAGTNYVGVLPWKDLGLSRSDVIDGYGNFYTYVVSGTANGVCESITKNFSATASMQEFTGQVITSTLEALLTTETAGTGRKVPFAIISHGPNGTGARTSGGTLTATPSQAGEQANSASASNPSRIYTGPINSDTASTTYFDDQVLVPSTTDIQEVCGQITPGGGINASLADSFATGATTANNFGNIDSAGVGANGVTVQASTADARNKVASFAVSTGGATSYLVTNSTNFSFNPVARAVYAKASWRAGANSATFSIATRATAADLTAGSDLFDAGSSNGLTFRFGSSLEIRNGTASQLASGTGITITSGTLYTLEVYDNGSDLWMRIYPAATPGSAATLTATNITVDTGGSQQVMFINPSTTATAEIDDVTVGFPMLAAETTGAITSYITSTGNGTSTGNLTLEAWVRPRALPSSGNNAALIAKWNTADESNSSFRLRINSAGQVYLDVASVGSSTTVENFAGPVLTANTWSHIAVSYTFTTSPSNGETVKFFQDGDPYSSTTNSVTGTAAGIKYTSVPDFYVGADLNSSTVADAFNGDIADVRVWEEARTPEQIRSYFQTRLSADSTDTSIDDLVVNWRLDAESLDSSNGLAFTSAAATGKGTAGTVHSTTLVPTLALYFRPLATTFCPGAVSGAYQCDFRVATASGAAGSVATLTVPNNLLSVYAKVWGAGGGGYDAGSGIQSAGGAGGYSAGRIYSVNDGTSNVPIYEINSNGTDRLKVYIGGFGAGSTDSKNGGGGGAGSGVFGYFGTTNRNGIVAGGGGGASYSSDDPTTGGDCGSVSIVGTTQQCGLGGLGGGLTATMADAFDAASQCGGRAGDNVSAGSGPPTLGGGTGDCDDGGGNNSAGNGGSAGTAGGVGGSDGSTNLLAGGRGADADTDNNNGAATNSSAAGGGGGGGGAVGGEAGGHDHRTARAGYGGGGGSAARDATGVTNAIGAIGSYTYTAGSTFNDTATAGAFTSNNNAPTTIPVTSKDPVAAGWAIGMTISGTGINNPSSTITAVTSTSVTVAAGQGNSSHAAGITLTVSSTTAASLTSTPGGTTDFYYKPSYVGSSYSSPAVGGSTSSSINGSAGAVVLIW